MSAFAYIVRVVRILLAAGLFAMILFGEAGRATASDLPADPVFRGKAANA